MENTGLSSGKVLSEECPQHKPKMADSLAFKSCILFFELKYILFTLSLFISCVGSRFSVSQKTEQEGSHLPLAPPGTNSHQQEEVANFSRHKDASCG